MKLTSNTSSKAYANGQHGANEVRRIPVVAFEGSAVPSLSYLSAVVSLTMIDIFKIADIAPSSASGGDSRFNALCEAASTLAGGAQLARCMFDMVDVGLLLHCEDDAVEADDLGEADDIAQGTMCAGLPLYWNVGVAMIDIMPSPQNPTGFPAAVRIVWRRSRAVDEDEGSLAQCPFRVLIGFIETNPDLVSRL